MEKSAKKYISFIICVALCFIIGHAVFYACQSNNLGLIRVINKYSITKNHDPPKYVGNSTNHIFNVTDFGAIGDGITDDTKAFDAAWNSTCKVKDGVLLVPSGFTFLLQPIEFDGISCQSNIIFQVDGNIVAPSNKSDWKSIDFEWILFTKISNGITLKGNGTIDGQGEDWWNHATIEDDEDSNYDLIHTHKIIGVSNIKRNRRPHALRIANSVNVTVTGISIQNSPKFHIFIGTCQQVNIFNFTVLSPKDSPNTDGIHLSRTQQVTIYNSTIAAGDDCISIQLGTSNVQIYDVHCKPGHGYSIGGLGFDKNVAQVSNVSVVNSTISDSLTGVRIKTWQGGSGFVQNILFSNISMSNVKTAITIDQNYCGGPKICPSSNDTNAVAISGVTYKNITGTYLCRAVSLVCSKYKPCENITIDTIDLIPSVGPMNNCMGHPICSNAFGTLLNNTTPPLKDCLLSEAQPPALPPTAQTPATPAKAHSFLF